MNSMVPGTLNSQPTNQSISDDDEINIAEYFDIIVDNKWIIALVAGFMIVLGLAYAYLTDPVYESNLLIQVEDSEKSAGSFLGDAASSLFDVKTPAAGEIEIIRSRMILGKAVENIKIYIDARPRYIPVIGAWLARRSSSLSTPGILGFGGFVSGSEKISVPIMDVPQDIEASPFRLTLGENTDYSLEHLKSGAVYRGEIGKDLIGKIGSGEFHLLVSAVSGKPGAQFKLTRFSKLQTLNNLQEEVKVVEKGKQSGVLDISLQSTDPNRLTLLLNEIGRLYVRQNIDRKAAEAEKTLGFLNTQLPQFKRQLEQSEDIYNRYRNKNGTVSLDDEAKNALTQTVTLQNSIIEVEQRRRELLSRFTAAHPSVQTLDLQINALKNEVANVNSKIKQLPILQQDTVRMQRDIKVNTDLYQSLLNSSLQMQLAKEGKVGNVRLLDEAVIAEEPVKPKKSLVIAASLLIGVFLGISLAVIRSSFFSGIRNPHEIEAHAGLNVYSTIPLSLIQAKLAKSIEGKQPGTHLLATQFPQDSAIESLRSLRTALQFAMLEAGNNRVLITGGTPAVGKSFISANFAAIMAGSGKRVLLVDADLRKGYLNQYFSLPRTNGLSELIAGAKSLNEVVHKVDVPNLEFISTGVLPPNPAELLMSDSFAAVMDRLSSEYDLVIIDAPPVLVAADTAAIAPHAGTILLVVRADKTHMGEVNESAKRLLHAGRAVDGVIFNAMDMTRRHYGRYGYQYGRYKYTQYKYGA